jgi:hypothetical protein
MAEGGHIALANGGQFTLVLGGQFAWIFHLMSFAPFYKAFNVQPGDKNYKPEEQRIKIW